MYIAPINSTHVKNSDLDKQIFAKLEEDCNKHSLNGDVIVMGDLNARINCKENDFIVNDSDRVLDNFLPDNYFSDSHKSFRNTQVNYGKTFLIFV